MTIEQTAPAESAEKSLREELQDAFSASTAAEDESVDSAPADSTGSRSRDDRGRFAGKQSVEDAAVAQTGTTSSPEAPGAPTATEQQQQQQQPAIARPANLKAELHGAWDAAPAELRKYITEREAEVHKGFTRMDEERQYGRQLRDVINPYMPLIQAQGGDAASAVKSLLNTAYIFNTGNPAQKVQALQAVAQQYGIPLDQVAQYQPQQRVDPNVAALQQQVHQLSQARQQEVAQREQAEQYQLQTAIQTFAANPGHQHFEQVKPHMAALLEKGLAKDMQDAYDQAIWARPDLRQTVLAAQQQTAEQARVTQAQARSAAAKQAAASVSGTPGISIPVAAPDRSLREEIRANFRAASH